MSYLNVPRLHFFGQFMANPSTVNNDLSNFNPGPIRPTWNPTGLASFLLNGTNQQGTQLSGCQVTSVMDASGTLVTSGDPLVGAQVQTSNTPVSGKLVDLDPLQQQVSQLFGLQLQVVLGGSNAGFTMKPGEFLEVPNLSDLWFVRATQGGSGDVAASGTFQTVIQPDQIQWNDVEASPLLQQFQQACERYGISVKLITDGYNADSSSPSFNIGRVVGALGPVLPGEPIRVVAGRRLIPLTQNPSQQGSGPFTFWSANFIVDEERYKAVFDIGNSYQVQGQAGPSVDLGTMTAVILPQGGQPVSLSPALDYQQSQYELTAGIVEADLTGDQISLIQSNPVGIVTDATGADPVLQEDPSGITVQMSQMFLRMSAEDTQSVQLIVRKFGQPLAGYELPVDFISADFLDQTFPQYPGLSANLDPDLNDPPSGIKVLTTGTGGGLGSVVSDADGTATLTLEAGSTQTAQLPPDRQHIDSQVYFLGGPWQGSSYIWWSQNYAPLTALVWAAYEAPAHPTWEDDVQPIFQEWMRVYPGMKQILDLTQYDVVKANQGRLKAVLSVPPTFPTYMPVTRDLAPAKIQMIIGWINDGLPRRAGG